MRFKNSLKLLAANFSLFWKLLVYKVLAVVVTFLLFLPVMGSVINAFESTAFMTDFVSFLTNSAFSNFTATFTNLFNLVELLISSLGVLIQTNLFAFIYTIFLIFIVLPFLTRLADVPTGEYLYGYMSSLSKFSFVACFIRKLGTSCVYSIISVLNTLPVYAIVIFGGYGILTMASQGGLTAVFAPFVFFVFICVILAATLTFMCGWMPATIVFNENTFKAYKRGIKAVFRDFFKILSNMLVICAIFFAATYIFGLISLIILIPIVAMLVSIFKMVMFFESQGMKYYVDLDTIIKPRKLEECDKLAKVKNII